MRATPRRRGHVITRWCAVFVCVGACTASADTGLRRYDFERDDRLTAAEHFRPWAGVMARARDERSLLDACYADATLCPTYLRGLRHVLVRARGLSPTQQIDLTNQFINRRGWRMERRSVDDWRTLGEFLRRGGDCEDFALAKYLVLRELGFAADDLRVVIAYDWKTRDHHAVLAIRDAGQARLLDVEGGTRHGTANPNYRYRYALNEVSIWDHTIPAKTIHEGENL